MKLNPSQREHALRSFGAAAKSGHHLHATLALIAEAITERPLVLPAAGTTSVRPWRDGILADVTCRVIGWHSADGNVWAPVAVFPDGHVETLTDYALAEDGAA